MANKTTSKIPVNKAHFMKVLKIKNSSIRKLGEAYDEIERTEKTIRRCLDEGEIPPDLLDRIAKHLDVYPDYLAGIYNEKADKIEDAYLRRLMQSHIKPDKYPYLLKAKSDINYSSYFESILTMNNISMELFHTLPPEERVLFRQEMVVAILNVIVRHLKKDSMGNDLSEELAYCESMVGDFDPFSLYLELEGIGLSDNDVEWSDDSDEISEFEQRMNEKYGITE